MDKLYQEIVFSIDNYEYDGETEDERRKLMWDDISSVLRILFKCEYEVKIYDDDVDIIVIQFEHNPRFEDWGSPRCMWVTADEAEDIEFSRKNLDKYLTTKSEATDIGVI